MILEAIDCKNEDIDGTKQESINFDIFMIMTVLQDILFQRLGWHLRMSGKWPFKQDTDAKTCDVTPWVIPDFLIMKKIYYTLRIFWLIQWSCDKTAIPDKNINLYCKNVGEWYMTVTLD